jgi:hypothetical protein
VRNHIPQVKPFAYHKQTMPGELKTGSKAAAATATESSTGEATTTAAKT